jgi:predicted MPP superfamily phosphohydrolase
VSVALEGVPDGAARVVFMHNPDTFAEIPAGAAPLGVAAHTHGGQIRVPSMPEWSWMALLQNERVHADGWIDGYGAPGNRLYVNRGIGFSTIPMRIFCPPEVTFFTLRRAPS